MAVAIWLILLLLFISEIQNDMLDFALTKCVIRITIYSVLEIRMGFKGN